MSKVSRSVYQKVAEENKRLKSDLRIIVMAQKPLSDLEKETIVKYRKQFQKEDWFHAVMKEAAKEYVAKNPDILKFLNENKNVRREEDEIKP